MAEPSVRDRLERALHMMRAALGRPTDEYVVDRLGESMAEVRAVIDALRTPAHRALPQHDTAIALAYESGYEAGLAAAHSVGEREALRPIDTDPREIVRRLQEAEVTTRHLTELRESKFSYRAGEKSSHWGAALSMVEAIILWWEYEARDEVLRSPDTERPSCVGRQEIAGDG